MVALGTTATRAPGPWLCWSTWRVWLQSRVQVTASALENQSAKVLLGWVAWMTSSTLPEMDATGFCRHELRETAGRHDGLAVEGQVLDPEDQILQ